MRKDWKNYDIKRYSNYISWALSLLPLVALLFGALCTIWWDSIPSGIMYVFIAVLFVLDKIIDKLNENKINIFWCIGGVVLTLMCAFKTGSLIRYLFCLVALLIVPTYLFVKAKLFEDKFIYVVVSILIYGGLLILTVVELINWLSIG